MAAARRARIATGRSDFMVEALNWIRRLKSFDRINRIIRVTYKAINDPEILLNFGYMSFELNSVHSV
jgi:hypothetical protein